MGCTKEDCQGTESATAATPIKPGELQMATQNEAARLVAKLPQTSMKVLKAPRLPHRSSLASSQNEAASTQDRLVAKLPQTSVKVLKVPRLPHRSGLGSSKHCTCHTKRGGAHTGQARRQASADLYEGTESATPATQIKPGELTPATQIEPKELQALHLPHKTRRRPHRIAKLPQTSI